MESGPTAGVSAARRRPLPYLAHRVAAALGSDRRLAAVMCTVINPTAGTDAGPWSRDACRCPRSHVSAPGEIPMLVRSTGRLVTETGQRSWPVVSCLADTLDDR